ncbi:MAG: DUF4123 domain-containing protein [Byssovorax sp.]
MEGTSKETGKPHAILEIQWGPLGGKKAILAPGATLRVGATDFADLAIPHDRTLSRVHFELSWDGETCKLRDLGSQRGTELDGAVVEEAELLDGAWIRAGETDFVFHVERGTPPRPRADLERDERAPQSERRRVEEARREEDARLAAAKQALSTLRREAERGRLYAITDAARDDRILELLQESVEEHRSLYEGVEGEAMSHIAPYLVGPLGPGSSLLEALLTEGWGNRWGIYLVCPLPFREIRRHFRHFLMVEVEETGERLYFRFFDPECLRIFLPTCSPRQISELRGPIERVFGEAPDRELLVLLPAERSSEGV